MTKAEITNDISRATGIYKENVLTRFPLSSHATLSKRWWLKELQNNGDHFAILSPRHMLPPY